MTYISGERADQWNAEDRQASVSMSLMDSFAAAALESLKASLIAATKQLEIIQWNTSAVDTSDMASQITDLLSDLEAMKIKFEESL